MKVVRLTNLGNKTLSTLLNLDKDYQENASLKIKRLEKLWGSREEREHFKLLFSSYHSNIVSPVIFEEKLDIGQFGGRGLVRIVDYPAQDLEKAISEIKNDEYTNPIKYLKTVNVELTGDCNLSCGHCCRGGSRNIYGLDSQQIKEALIPLLRAGVNKVIFSGGEPTLRRKDLVELTQFLAQFLLTGPDFSELSTLSFADDEKARRKRDYTEKLLATDKYLNLKKELTEGFKAGGIKELSEENQRLIDTLVKSSVETEVWELLLKENTPSNKYLDSIGILSNGTFDCPAGLLEKLKPYHAIMALSLDSFDKEVNDKNRGKGHFEKVKEVVRMAKERNFPITINTLNFFNNSKEQVGESYQFFKDNSFRIDELEIVCLGKAALGNFGYVNKENNYFGELSSSKKTNEGWCKGYTRPIGLYLRAKGEVGVCPYGHALPEEFGNIKNTPMTGILNNIQTTNIFRLVREKKIEDYQYEVDKEIFPRRFRSSCEPFLITLAYALLKESRQKSRRDIENREISEKVGRLYGFME